MEKPPEDSRVAPGDGSPALALDRVSASYPGSSREALSSATLCVRAGEITALLGPNGAGKSTLLRVAAGLLRPTRGSARVDGKDVRDVSRETLARVVAVVPQSEAVASGFRVRDVVAMGRAPHQGSWMNERPGDRAVVQGAIDRCDLAELADRRIETLSCGEQRRVAIARALAQKPRLLLLDEPAAFLDVRHRLELHELLANRAATDGIACVVAMHDLDAAARFASHAVLMRQGRVIASGAPAEVMTPDRLLATFDADVDVGVHAPSGRLYFVPLRSSVP